MEEPKISFLNSYRDYSYSKIAKYTFGITTYKEIVIFLESHLRSRDNIESLILNLNDTITHELIHYYIDSLEEKKVIELTRVILNRTSYKPKYIIEVE